MPAPPTTAAHPPTPILGVDIGRAGALALLSPAGDLLDVADMPVLDDGPRLRPTVSAPRLGNLLEELRQRDD